MKLFLETLTLTLLLLFLADTRITFSPFSITFGRGRMVLGIIMIMCGCLFLKYHWYEEGMKKGAEMKEEVKKLNRKKLKGVYENITPDFKKEVV